jgi:hypothetical protein
MKKTSLLLSIMLLALSNISFGQGENRCNSVKGPKGTWLFLDGNPANGSVKLSSPALSHDGTPDHYPSAGWQIVHLGNGEFALMCLGKPNLYLAGNIENGTVKLVSNTNEDGTHWKEVTLPAGTVGYVCAGKVKNPQHVYLMGNSEDFGINLVSNTNQEGTHWRVQGFNLGAH